MSKSTPFIAKILIYTIDPVALEWGGGFGNNFSAYILYDNSGNPPVSCNQYPTSSTCILQGAPSAPPLDGVFSGPGPSGPPSAIIQFLSNANAYSFDYTLNAGNVAWMPGFMICKPTTLLTLGSPPVHGVGDGVMGLWSTGADTELAWWDSAWAKKLGLTNVGMTFTVLTPGAANLINSWQSFCATYAAWENGAANLDFDGVDLSGEDFSQTVLASEIFVWLPGAPPITVRSTWANANLSDTNFAGNTIALAAFDNAIMNGTNFTGATLSNVTFNGTTGLSPTFSGATLIGVSFSLTQIVKPVFDSKSVLGGADFSYASLPGTDFSNCDLRDVNFTGGNFSNAKFDSALLQGAIFDSATLTDTDFTGASLQGTKFTNTDVTSAIFSPSPNFSTDPTNPTSFAGSLIPEAFNQYNWQYLDLSAVKFPAKPTAIANLNAQWALLKGIDFSNVVFTASDPVNTPTTFANAMLANASFAGASLEAAVFTSANGEADEDPTSPYTNVANFTGANLHDCLFDSALMAGVDFSFALLWGDATVAGATLSGTVFADAYLASTHFDGLTGEQCAGLVFSGACLVNATFAQTTLQASPTGTPVLLDGAFLQGADFSTATLSAVNLDGAVLATESGSVTPVFTTSPPGIEPLFPLSYGATLLDPSQTNSSTMCVTGSPGPCSASQIAPPDPMPASWTQPLVSQTARKGGS